MIFILNAIGLILNVYLLKKFLHVFQLRNYNFTRYFNFFSIKYCFYIIFCAIFVVFELIFKNLLFILIFNFILLICEFFLLNGLLQQNKTPLKFTNKLKRLYAISAFIIAIFVPIPVFIPFICCIILFVPTLANLLNFYDKLKNKKFINLAKQKLKKSKTKIIAITGSNGKTSVKNILFSILSSQYIVQATPESYNTPLGIAKFINEKFNPNSDFLILEYGARRPGDIKELCELYGADFGIITTIAPQHLQTFKNIETIKQTKNELAIFLENRFCVFNLDNRQSFELYQHKSGEKQLVSIKQYCDVFASNITIQNGKTMFNLHIGNQTYRIETSLLGEHNILNILQSVSIAHKLNVPICKIIESVYNLKPVPHRLELIKTHINILDDSYNCSILSAKQAINTLKSFNGRKMIATPGIIEGGKRQSRINFELGEMLADFNFVVVIGNVNKDAITSGLKSKSFNMKNCLFANNLEHAKQYFHLLKENETLLLLNDLPDDYN